MFKNLVCNFTQSIVFAIHTLFPKYFLGGNTKGRNFKDADIKMLADKLGIHNICV